MLKVMSTQNLTGVEIIGLSEDFKSLQEAIKKILKSEKRYKHVLIFNNTIKKVCKEETYCFKLVWPELLFFVFSIQELLYKNAKKRFNKKMPYDYVIINYLKELIFNELKNIIGDVKYLQEEKKYNDSLFYRNKKMIIIDCIPQWVDVMNTNYLKAKTVERIEILSQWFSWIMDRTRIPKYRILQSEIWNYARINNMKENSVIVPTMEYNGEIIW